jgi:hypothetical protein
MLKRFPTRVLAFAAMIIAAALPTATAQEREPRNGEYAIWFGGSFENGHAFSSTVDARIYQLEGQYKRLIYWNAPLAVRWVFDAIPVTLVGDPHTSNGHRAYAFGFGGSPVNVQVNIIHFRGVEPFLTTGGGALYFNHRMFGTTQQFNFTAQLGAGVQLYRSNRTAIDLGYKYHHISNANLAKRNPGMDSHIFFIGVSFMQ